MAHECFELRISRGETRCGGAGETVSRRWGERDNAQQRYARTNPGSQVPQMRPSRKPTQEQRKCYALMRTERTVRASAASSCSNSGLDDHATSMALICNTASFAGASSWCRSQMHRQIERPRVSPQKLSSLNASSTSLDAESVQVKRVLRLLEYVGSYEVTKRAPRHSKMMAT